MNKTLTALALTGALALGACSKLDQDEVLGNGARVRVARNDTYKITVVDQESERLTGVLPRAVEMAGRTDKAVPYGVYGRLENALAPGAKGATFTSGIIVHYRGDAVGCYWGDRRKWDAVIGPDPILPVCADTEVRNVQPLLTQGVDYVTKP